MKYTLLLLLTCLSIHLGAQPFLHTPIAGEAGKDYTIVNYVDWDLADIQDAFCGSKTYDGHQGTDFTLRSFKQMDSSISILAAADGEVVFIQDGLFDREKISDVSKGFGNYIAIKHPNKYYTYYAHLKKGSLNVKVGDQVKAGDEIAALGSSGNSTDPHLHFEVYFDSMYVVDPFMGNCGNSESLWLDQLPYETALKIWEVGMHNELIGIDDLRERVTTVECCPFTFPTESEKPVLLWSHMYGLKKGSTLTANWYTPANELWFTYDYEMEQDWWYYYFWTYINNEGLEEGTWSVELEYDGAPITRQEFVVDQSLNTREAPYISAACKPLETAPWSQLLEKYNAGTLEIFNLQGQVLSAEQIQLIPSIEQSTPNIYLLREQSENGQCIVKRYR